MFAVGRDQKVITGRKFEGFTVFKFQDGPAACEENPFRVILIIPETGFAGLAVGDDIFQIKTWPAQYRYKLLCFYARWLWTK